MHLNSVILLACVVTVVAVVHCETIEYFSGSTACAGAPDFVSSVSKSANCNIPNNYCFPYSASGFISESCSAFPADSLVAKGIFKGNEFIALEMHNDTKCKNSTVMYAFKVLQGNTQSVCARLGGDGNSSQFMMVKQNADLSLDMFQCADSSCTKSCNKTLPVSVPASAQTNCTNIYPGVPLFVKSVVNLTPLINSTKKQGDTISDSTCSSIGTKIYGAEQHCSQLNLLTSCISTST